jgi:hypothetical protein
MARALALAVFHYGRHQTHFLDDYVHSVFNVSIFEDAFAYRFSVYSLLHVGLWW